MIQRGGQEVEVDDGKEKAAILISNAFSPVQPGWKEEYATAVNINSEDPDITVVEVKTAPTKTSPFKAPGIDGIPSYSFTVFSVVSAAPYLDLFLAGYLAAFGHLTTHGLLQYRRGMNIGDSIRLKEQAYV